MSAESNQMTEAEIAEIARRAMPAKVWDIDGIITANKVRGWYFFDASAMRGFKSRILPTVYQGKGGIFFVTSEKDDHSPRFYKVRVFNPETGNVRSVRNLDRLSKYKAEKLAQSAANGELTEV